jgi:mono/diheme cytochrome c family protein
MKTLKKIFKGTGISLLTIILILVVIVMMRQHQKFDAPYPAIHASTDSTIIANGKYLFYGPAHCMECHGNKSIAQNTDSVPSGGFQFVLPIGVMTAPNITSDKEFGIGNFTDAQIARTLRYGVGSDSRAVFDFMPFHNTSDEDLTAIISYIRTLPAEHVERPRVQLNTLGRVVTAFLLKPVGPAGPVEKKVERAVSVEYGKYLAHSVANCRGCHTNRDLMTGAFIGKDFAGGFKMDVPGKPGMFLVSRNLTPDKETGHIYSWSEEKFIQRFRQGKLIADSPMPWGPFGKMSDDDLKAIYKYLNTVDPVKNDPGPVIITENIN